MLCGSDRDQGTEVGDKLRHMTHPNPFTTGPAVTAVIECVGDKSGGTESLGDMVIAGGMLAVPVRQYDHPARLGGGRGGIRSPHVVDDADSTHSVERSLGSSGVHQPRLQVVIKTSYLKTSQNVISVTPLRRSLASVAGVRR